MPTTSNGIPYPQGSDVPDVPYWNQQLAEAVDPFVEFSDWQTVPLLNGWTAVEPFQYCRIAGVIYYRGELLAPASGSVSGQPFATLPEHARPTSRQRVQWGWGSSVCYVAFEMNGDVTSEAGARTSSPGMMLGHINFPRI